MEKSCRWCVYFNVKERKCDRLESGFKYDRETTVKTITNEVEDEVLSELANLEQDIDYILDNVSDISSSHILEIGTLFSNYRDIIGKRIKNRVDDELDWIEYDGLKTITDDDDEFYCKYWR
mgnify:CR=1 FL=1